MKTNDVLSGSLLGALLIDQGLVTQEQIEACLLLQRQDHPRLPLGEIIVRCGYINRGELERTLERQRELRRSLIATVEAHGPAAPHLHALLLSSAPRPEVAAIVHQAGVEVTQADHLPPMHSPPDLLLADPAALNALRAPLPPEVQLGLLPPPGDATPAALSALVERYIAQARASHDLRASVERYSRSDYELQVLAVLMREVSLAGSAREALGRLMTIIRDLIPVEAGTLFRLDRDSKHLVFEFVLGPYSEELSQQQLPIDRGIAGWVATHGESLLIPDVSQDARFHVAFDKKTGFQTRSVLCVPLTSLGQICGVFQLINKLDGEFSQRDLLLLRITADVGGLLLMLDTIVPTSSPAWLGSLI
jgi:putative methionine-R-sulfoxide reductase with GAF domain